MITTEPPILTGHDCCDRCSAPAKVRALQRTCGELLFASLYHAEPIAKECDITQLAPDDIPKSEDDLNELPHDLEQFGLVSKTTVSCSGQSSSLVCCRSWS